jgi:hypothetical protein
VGLDLPCPVAGDVEVPHRARCSGKAGGEQRARGPRGIVTRLWWLKGARRNADSWPPQVCLHPLRQFFLAHARLLRPAGKRGSPGLLEGRRTASECPPNRHRRRLSPRRPWGDGRAGRGVCTAKGKARGNRSPPRACVRGDEHHRSPRRSTLRTAFTP